MFHREKQLDKKKHAENTRLRAVVLRGVVLPIYPERLDDVPLREVDTIETSSNLHAINGLLIPTS